MIMIVGASGGIGRALFDFYSDKDDTIGTYLNRLPDEIVKSRMYRLDITNSESVKKIFTGFNKENIRIINCTGITDNTFAHKSDPEDWKKIIDTNLVGSYYLSRFALPLMRNQKYGRIVFFSSIVAQRGSLGTSAYAASKAGLWGLAKALSLENGSMGITVNCINLGYAEVGMGIEKVPEKYRQVLMEQIPSQRYCTIEEVIAAVEFLLNTEYVNGSSIDLNGGLY